MTAHPVRNPRQRHTTPSKPDHQRHTNSPQEDTLRTHARPHPPLRPCTHTNPSTNQTVGATRKTRVTYKPRTHNTKQATTQERDMRLTSPRCNLPVFPCPCKSESDRHYRYHHCSRHDPESHTQERSQPHQLKYHAHPIVSRLPQPTGTPSAQKSGRDENGRKPQQPPTRKGV